MLPSEPRPPTRAIPPDAIREAFREVHGRRLHGFALLLALGDRAQAAALASNALIAGAERVDRLRHPERAAAWLRARVVDGARHAGVRRGHRGPAWSTLIELGTDAAVVAGLEALDRVERAAVLAADAEGLDPRDVEIVVSRRGARLARLLATARERYSTAYGAAAMGGAPTSPGPLASRLNDIAHQAMR